MAVDQKVTSAPWGGAWPPCPPPSWIRPCYGSFRCCRLNFSAFERMLIYTVAIFITAIDLYVVVGRCVALDAAAAAAAKHHR